MEISNYSVEKLEEYDLWLLHLTLKNTTDTTIDTNGIYKLTYYGDDNKIINIATDRFMFKIEPNNELILGIGLEFDGSLLRNFSMERIED